MFVESERALVGIVQLLYREDPYVDILLQEYINVDYDVRVIVVAGQVLGAMKRPKTVSYTHLTLPTIYSV